MADNLPALPGSPADLEGWTFEELRTFALERGATILSGVRLAAGLILHRLRQIAPSGSWTATSEALSEAWGISDRTIRNWISGAEAHYGLPPATPEVAARRAGQANRYSQPAPLAPARKARPTQPLVPDEIIEPVAPKHTLPNTAAKRRQAELDKARAEGTLPPAPLADARKRASDTRPVQPTLPGLGRDEILAWAAAKSEGEIRALIADLQRLLPTPAPRQASTPARPVARPAGTRRAEVDPKLCVHPSGRRVGSTCMACGTTVGKG